MNINVELYKDNSGKKHVFISPNDCGSGATYSFQTGKDIGNAVCFYLLNYYPEYVENPDYEIESEDYYITEEDYSIDGILVK